MREQLDRKRTDWLVVLAFMLLLGLGGCRGVFAKPQPRNGGQMVYDSVGDQVLLFGGRGNGSIRGDLYGDLWSLDLESKKWEKIELPGGPAPRLSPGLVYDPVRHQLVLFGGHTNSDRVNDTWLLDLDNLEWREINPAVSPPARSDMGMAFDEKNQVVVLFGGYCLEVERDLCDDTWIFDPAANQWVEMEPESSPPVMYGLSLDYDSRGDTLLLFGGHMSRFSGNVMSSAGYNDSVWSYSYQDNAWEEFPREGSGSPVKRYWHQAAYLSEKGGLFVFGGDNGNTYLSDSWLFETDALSWTRLRPEGSPPARIVGALVSSPAHGQLVLFGGLDNDFERLNDTWIYTASTNTWEQVLP